MGTQFRSHLQMMLFKSLTVLLLVSLSWARPGGDTSEEEGKEDHDHTIVRCLLENWGQEEKIKACRDCFDALGEDVLSGINLPIAKQCTRDYLPMQYAACETDIAALNAGDKEQGMQVMQCMGEAMHTNGLNYCLNTTSTAAAVVDRLTDASMCLGEGHKYIMQYVKNDTMASATTREKRKMKMQGKKMKFKMVKLMTKAHCDLASAGDTTNDKDCTDCFKSAIKSFKKDQNKAALVSASTQCSTDYLGDMYSECTTLMQTEPESAHKCFMRVLTKSEVGECTDASSTADAETLAGVMECTRKRAIAWVQENASGKFAEKFIAMLQGFENDDAEEDLQ